MAIKKLKQNSLNSQDDVIPVGTVIAYGGDSSTTLPKGWLLCDGSSFSSITYPQLAGIVSNYFSASSGTTYYLPDFRGQTPIGAGAGGSLTTRALGTSVGAESVTLTAAQTGVKVHQHTNSITSLSHNHSATIFNSNAGRGTAGSNQSVRFSAGVSTGSTSIGLTLTNVASTNVNATNAHNNMQPSLVVNFIIRAL
jgi:microcystin-dependent protein